MHDDSQTVTHTHTHTPATESFVEGRVPWLVIVTSQGIPILHLNSLYSQQIDKDRPIETTLGAAFIAAIRNRRSSSVLTEA